MRHVQRIRKWYIANNPVEKGEEKNMDEEYPTKEDVFDTKLGMDDWEMELINKVNEGGWSLQELEKKTDLTMEVIKNTLRNYHYMITENVLDEDFDGVYYIFKNNNDVISGNQLSPTEIKPEGESVNSDGNDDFWEVDIDCVTACSKVEKKIKVFMSRNAREKALMYMKWAKAREWLAYLIGEKKDDGYYVFDLYLPDQRTSAALVDKVVAEKYNQLSIVGVIHSHHEMGAGDEDHPSFSGHDANFINGNHDLSLLAGRDKKNNGFKVVGIARAKTPCGSLMQVKADVKHMPEEISEQEKELKDEFFSKVFSGSGNGNQEYDSFNSVLDKGDGSYHFVNKNQVGFTKNL